MKFNMLVSLLIFTLCALKLSAAVELNALPRCQARDHQNCQENDNDCNSVQIYGEAQPWDVEYFPDIAFCDSTKLVGDNHGQCTLKFPNGARCFYNRDCLSTQCERGVCQPCQDLPEMLYAKARGARGSYMAPCSSSPEYACGTNLFCSMNSAVSPSVHNADDLTYEMPICKRKIALNESCSNEYLSWYLRAYDEDWLRLHALNGSQVVNDILGVEGELIGICNGTATCHNVQLEEGGVLTQLCADFYQQHYDECAADVDCQDDLICFRNGTDPTRRCHTLAERIGEGEDCTATGDLDPFTAGGCADGLVCSLINASYVQTTCNQRNLALGDTCYGQNFPYNGVESAVHAPLMTFSGNPVFDPRCPDPFICFNNTCSEYFGVNGPAEEARHCEEGLYYWHTQGICIRPKEAGDDCGEDDDDLGPCPGSCMPDSLQSSSADGECVADESIAEGGYCTASSQCVGANTTDAVCAVCGAPNACTKCDDYYGFYDYFNYFGIDDDDDNQFINMEAHPFACKLVTTKQDFRKGQCVKMATLRGATRGELTEGALKLVNELQREGYTYDSETFCDLTPSGLQGWVESKMLDYSSECYDIGKASQRLDGDDEKANHGNALAERKLAADLRRCGSLLNEEGIGTLKQVNASCEALLARAVCCDRCRTFTLQVGNSEDFNVYKDFLLLDKIRVDCATKTLNYVDARCCGAECFVQNCGGFITNIMGGSVLSSVEVAGGAAGEGGLPAAADDVMGKAVSSAAKVQQSFALLIVLLFASLNILK